MLACESKYYYNLLIFSKIGNIFDSLMTLFCLLLHLVYVKRPLAPPAAIPALPAAPTNPNFNPRLAAGRVGTLFTYVFTLLSVVIRFISMKFCCFSQTVSRREPRRGNGTVQEAVH